MAKAGRPKGAENKDKPFREALRMELAALGPDHKALRSIARNLIDLASKGDPSAMAAIKEVADRTDGKVPQGIGGDSELAPINLRHEVEVQLVDVSKLEGRDD